MALTQTYSFTSVVPKTAVPTFAGLDGSDSDTVGLSGGGFATSVTDTSGFSDITFYNSVGTVVGSNFGFGSAGGRLAQLTNGNVVAVGTSSSGVNFAIDTATGGGVSSGSITTSTNESNADVAALTGGGFVVVDQHAFTAPDHDIEVYVRDASGAAVTSFAVDFSGADDENASVAGLADGGFAVAWDRTDASANSTMWYAVYNADGTARLGPTQLDGAGTINRRPNVTALASGGFTIGYEDNGWDGTQPDITVATLDSAGTFQNFVRASTLTSDDSEASVSTLSNGMVISTFTNNFNNGGDLDIRMTLVDPTGAVALTSVSNPISIDFTSDITTASSVSAYGLAQFAVSYSNATPTSAVDVQAYQLVRTVTGTSGADNFTGDDAVNIVNGGAGDDVLKGGRNGDTLTGSIGNDKLFGVAGNDTLIGGLGDDVLNGSAGIDTVRYLTNAAVTVNLSLTGPQNTIGDGTDTLTSIENLTGGNGSDTLIGSNTSNRIIGGVGNDTITGGLGGDNLNGNGGSDTFVYNALADSGAAGRDKILDFLSGTDKVDLSAIDANSVAAGNQAFTFIGVAAFSGVAGQLDVSHIGGTTYVQGDVNGDKVRDFQIAFSGNLSLAATDFTL